MAQEKLSGPELKKMVKLSKKQELAFAFSPGKKRDGHLVMIDRRKSPSMLAKLAKADGESPKVAFGKINANGRVVELTCERVVPKLAKVLKDYFRTQKISVNVIVKDAEGNELESEVEELEDDPDFDAEDDGDTLVAAQDDAEEDEDEDDAKETREAVAALAERLKEVQPAVAAQDGETGDKLKTVLAAAVAQIKAGDIDKAKTTVAALEKAVAKLDAAPEEEKAPAQDARAMAARAAQIKETITGIAEPVANKLTQALIAAAKEIKASNLQVADAMLTKIEAAAGKALSAPPAETPLSPEAAKWAEVQPKLAAAVEQAMRAKTGDLDAINRTWNYAQELASDGAFDRALAASAKLAELLKEAKTADTSAAVAEPEESAPDNVVPYVQSRLAWISTRTNLRQEIAGLKSAIDIATTGVEGLEDVSSRTGGLFSHLDGIDGSLEETLEKLAETADGPDREKLKARARQIIDSYRGVLDTPFFQAVDDNGFVKTNIRGQALSSLKQVQDALSA